MTPFFFAFLSPPSSPNWINYRSTARTRRTLLPPPSTSLACHETLCRYSRNVQRFIGNSSLQLSRPTLYRLPIPVTETFESYRMVSSCSVLEPVREVSSFPSLLLSLFQSFHSFHIDSDPKPPDIKPNHSAATNSSQMIDYSRFDKAVLAIQQKWESSYHDHEAHWLPSEWAAALEAEIEPNWARQTDQTREMLCQYLEKNTSEPTFDSKDFVSWYFHYELWLM